jgi:hypothetical protein
MRDGVRPLRTKRITFAPRSARSSPISRPTAEPAAISSTTTSVRAFAGIDSFAVRVVVSAVAVSISNCEPI